MGALAWDLGALVSQDLGTLGPNLLLNIVSSRNFIMSVGIQMQGLDQKNSFPETLDLNRENKILMSIIVVSRNDISIEIKIQGLDPKHRLTEKS